MRPDPEAQRDQGQDDPADRDEAEHELPQRGRGGECRQAYHPHHPDGDPDRSHRPVGEPGQELSAEGGADDDGQDQEIEDVPDGRRGVRAWREDHPDDQREERRDREEDHADEVGRPSSRRHDSVAEEPERDERVLRPKLPEHEGDDDGGPKAEQADRPQVGPRPPAVDYLIEREHHRGNPAD